MTHVIVCDDGRADARLHWALTESAGAGLPDRIIMTLSPDGSRTAAPLTALGFEVYPLGEMRPTTFERGIAGAVHALDGEVVTLLGAMKVLPGLPAIRDLPRPPTVEAHVAATGATPWDEATLLSVRVGALIDRYVVEDLAGERRLTSHGIREHRIVRPPDDYMPAVPSPDSEVLVVHDLSWERRSEFAARLARFVNDRTPCATTSIASADHLSRSLNEPHAPPGRLVIVERSLESLAIIRHARRRGWRVAHPYTGMPSDDADLLLGASDETWAATVTTWVNS